MGYTLINARLRRGKPLPFRQRFRPTPVSKAKGRQASELLFRERNRLRSIPSFGASPMTQQFVTVCRRNELIAETHHPNELELHETHGYGLNTNARDVEMGANLLEKSHRFCHVGKRREMERVDKHVASSGSRSIVMRKVHAHVHHRCSVPYSLGRERLYLGANVKMDMLAVRWNGFEGHNLHLFVSIVDNNHGRDKQIHFRATRGPITSWLFIVSDLLSHSS